MDWLKVTTGNVVTRPRSFSVSMTQCDKPVSFHSRVFYVRALQLFQGRGTLAVLLQMSWDHNYKRICENCIGSSFRTQKT